VTWSCCACHAGSDPGRHSGQHSWLTPTGPDAICFEDDPDAAAHKTMALLWQVRPRRTSPTVQLRTNRPFRITALLVFLIFVAGLISFRSLEHFHVVVCQGATFLANSGLCSSDSTLGWNLFYHLGGNGPWIRKKDGLYYYDTPLPSTCRITQAHMVSPVKAEFLMSISRILFFLT
jgi:hypothetical protein